MTTITLDSPSTTGRLEELVDRLLAALFKADAARATTGAQPCHWRSTMRGGSGSPATWTVRWRCWRTLTRHRATGRPTPVALRRVAGHRPAPVR